MGHMNAMDYWELFMRTGAPEFYVKYNQAKRMESSHVFNDQGIGAAGHRLQ